MFQPGQTRAPHVGIGSWKQIVTKVLDLVETLTVTTRWSIRSARGRYMNGIDRLSPITSLRLPGDTSVDVVVGRAEADGTGRFRPGANGLECLNKSSSHSSM